MKSSMKSVPASLAGYAILTIILTAGAAQSLAGTDTVTSDDIVDGTITSSDIKVGGILGSRIRDESVNSIDIAPEAVGSSELAANAVISGKIGVDAVGAAEIATDAIGSTEIAANAITNSKMATDSVATDEIVSDAVGSAEIASNAVGAAEIATDAVGSSEISTGAVGSAEVNNRTLTLDDFATAEDSAVVTTTSINANSCVTIATGLSGAAVGDLPIVVLRSATAGTFWEGLRVTTAGQFPLRGCNTTDGNLGTATSTIDVFTVRP